MLTLSNPRQGTLNNSLLPERRGGADRGKYSIEIENHNEKKTPKFFTSEEESLIPSRTILKRLDTGKGKGVGVHQG